jgi:hypothetical protein
MDEESRRRLIHSGIATEKELDLAAERDTLRAEIARLRDALKYYADDKKWEKVKHNSGNGYAYVTMRPETKFAKQALRG